MNKSFFDLTIDEQQALITMASDNLDLSEVIIEKDLWLCWLLEKVFALPITMAFKGGTSLSKAYGLINRFSEDVDITIDYSNFQQINLESSTRSQFKKISGQLKVQLKNYIERELLPHLKQEISKSFDEKNFELTLSKDGEQLRFYYPSSINNMGHYLRDHVLLEFGVRNNIEPCEQIEVSTYLSKFLDNSIILPKPSVNTLSPIRTFWEKATLIHVACHREQLKKSPERLSRHWYDLHMLANSTVGPSALQQIDILNNVINHKKAFFNASYANYENCLNGQFRLVPNKQDEGRLAEDFNEMINAEMFPHEPPSFIEIMKTLQALEAEINQINTIDSKK